MPAVAASLDTPGLTGTHASPLAAASAVLALIEAGDAPGLLALALSEAEFREIVYPALPASRPERNTSATFVWDGLYRKSRNSLAFTLDRHAGEAFEVSSVDFLGETTDYGGFLVHRETALTVRRGGGEPEVVRLFGSMIEQDGRFKIFSFVTD